MSDSSVKERFVEIYDKTYDSIYRYLITKVSPREAADLVMYLCSDQSTYMTGAVIPLDGGF